MEILRSWYASTRFMGWILWKKYEMLRRTTSRSAPWHIVRSDDKHLSKTWGFKIILNSVDYDGRNYSLDFEANEEINISVQKNEKLFIFLQMRKNKKIIFESFVLSKFSFWFFLFLFYFLYFLLVLDSLLFFCFYHFFLNFNAFS